MMKDMPGTLLAQARACAALGSPFMENLLSILAELWPISEELTAFCAEFEGDIGPSGHSLPLRLAGALHHLVLNDETHHDLRAVYPPNTVTTTALRQVIRRIISDHEPAIIAFMQNAPQTNEIRRSAALRAATQFLLSQINKPLKLSELGASAGLNLHFPDYALDVSQRHYGSKEAAITLSPEWTGAPPPDQEITIAERRSVDLSPVDLGNPAMRLRLLAYLWPDQPERLERTMRALSLPRQTVDRGDAVEWLAQRLTRPQKGVLHLIYHTIAWQYFPQNAQNTGRALLLDAGAKARPDTPFAWLGIEADGQKLGAHMQLTLWDGSVIEGTRYSLGRMDFHGRWITWSPKEIEPMM